MVTDAEKLRGSRPNIFIDVSQVSKLDTFGAWLIERLRRSLTMVASRPRSPVCPPIIPAWSTRCAGVKAEPVVETRSVTITGMLEQVGRSVAGVGGTLLELIEMLGACCRGRQRHHSPRGFRLTSTVHTWSRCAGARYRSWC